MDNKLSGPGIWQIYLTKGCAQIEALDENGNPLGDEDLKELFHADLNVSAIYDKFTPNSDASDVDISDILFVQSADLYKGKVKKVRIKSNNPFLIGKSSTDASIDGPLQPALNDYN